MYWDYILSVQKPERNASTFQIHNHNNGTADLTDQMVLHHEAEPPFLLQAVHSLHTRHRHRGVWFQQIGAHTQDYPITGSLLYPRSIIASEIYIPGDNVSISP